MSDGLFDDGAVIRRVVREGSLLAGGGCAVLLQVSNPGVGLGVHEHSDFAYRPVDRLRTTMTYIYAVVFGTREEAERVGRIVSAMHRKVTGPTYSANDPELQVWVNATLYHTGMRLHRALFGPLPEAQADEVYQQYRVLATTIGTPEGAWPANRTEFDAYWDLMIKSLRVNDEARFLARQLLEPELMPLAVRPLMRLHRFVTIGLLPEPIREQFGFSWDERRQRRLNRLRRAAAIVYPRLPGALRQLPRNYYLADMRKRMKKTASRAPAAV